MDLELLVTQLGAGQVATVAVADIVFEPAFREACRANSCGMFDRCWTCPPCIGEIDDLIALARQYRTALVYQTVHDIEDSYDIEGMLEGGAVHNQLAHRINAQLRGSVMDKQYLHLGAGGCKLCPTCAKRDDQPCRHSDLATSAVFANHYMEQMLFP